jgi:hypothetical protein
MKGQRVRKDQRKMKEKEQEIIVLWKPEEEATIIVEARKNGLEKQRENIVKDTATNS